MTYAPERDVKVPPAQPLILREDDKIPLFLVKLWNIVEDPAYYEVIRWDESGYSFHILDPYSFCRNVLPQYFKHNNLNSLIRQLNMYGFRKMTPIERTSLARAESDQDHLEFSHPCFVREHPELLINIKRKAPASRQTNNEGTVSVPAKDLTAVFEELRSLRERQMQMEGRMSDLVKENELIWQEMSNMRGAHVKQQQIVTKLVQFMVTMLQPSKRLNKRHLLAIDESPSKRLRSDIRLPTVQHNNVSEVLDRLMHEYSVCRDQTQQGPLVGSSNGPIISDVTDELDHLGPPSGSRPSPSVSQPYSQDHFRVPQQYYRSQTVNTPAPSPMQSGSMPVPMNTNVMQGCAQPVTRVGRVPQVQCQPAPQNVYTPESVTNPIRTSDPNLMGPSPVNEDPLITSPPSANINLSPSEFAEYLNSVDQSITNCRDLIGGHWDDLDLDGLLDFEADKNDEQTKSPVQQQSADQSSNVQNPKRSGYGMEGRF